MGVSTASLPRSLANGNHVLLPEAKEKTAVRGKPGKGKGGQ